MLRSAWGLAFIPKMMCFEAVAVVEKDGFGMAAAGAHQIQQMTILRFPHSRGDRRESDLYLPTCGS